MDLEKKHRECTLLSLLENWQENLGAGNLTSTMLIELSKAYDTLPPDLVLAKLEAYGFNLFKVSFFLETTS